MRSDTAFFSAADISRRFLAGLASDLLSAAAAAFVGEEERRDVERAVGADAPRICSTSVNALIAPQCIDEDPHGTAGRPHVLDLATGDPVVDRAAGDSHQLTRLRDREGCPISNHDRRSSFAHPGLPGRSTLPDRPKGWYRHLMTPSLVSSLWQCAVKGAENQRLALDDL